MASAVGKTPAKTTPAVKAETTPQNKQNQNEIKPQEKEKNGDKNQGQEKPKGRENRFQSENRFQNRRGGRNPNQRFGQRGGGNQPRDNYRESSENPFAGNPFADEADFFGEQNEGPKEPKKFTGRCRLFVGNITPDVTEEQFKEMFTPFGEVSEVFVNAARGFGFIRLDFRINAERAKMELDGQMRSNRVLRVRFATHGAALKVLNLSPFVSNELLEHAFSQFGEIERAVVCVDDRGRSCGEGIVEFARKPGAQAASKRINEGVFLLSAYPRPIRVEILEQRDEEDGLTEKFVQRNEGFRKDREKEPRFAPPGSFEFEFGNKHRQIDDMEKERIERTKQDMENERTRLAEEMETAIFDYQADQIRQDLMRQQEELKRLDEMKNEHMRRRQEMDMRRREQQQMQSGGMGDSMLRQEDERRREMMMRASNAMSRDRDVGMSQGPQGPSRGPPGGRQDDAMMRGGPGLPGGTGMRENPGSQRGPSSAPSGPGGIRESQRGPGTPPMPPPPVPPGMNMDQNRSGGGSMSSSIEGRYGQGSLSPGREQQTNLERAPPSIPGKGEPMVHRARRRLHDRRPDLVYDVRRDKEKFHETKPGRSNKQGDSLQETRLDQQYDERHNDHEMHHVENRQYEHQSCRIIEGEEYDDVHQSDDRSPNQFSDHRHNSQRLHEAGPDWDPEFRHNDDRFHEPRRNWSPEFRCDDDRFHEPRQNRSRKYNRDDDCSSRVGPKWGPDSRHKADQFNQIEPDQVSELRHKKQRLHTTDRGPLSELQHNDHQIHEEKTVGNSKFTPIADIYARDKTSKAMIDDESVLLRAQCVRVGSFQGTTVEPVLLSENGFQICLEEKKGSVDVNINPTELKKCSACFHKKTCMIFLLVDDECAKRTRTTLKMPEASQCKGALPDIYFDPTNEDIKFKQIVISVDEWNDGDEQYFWWYMKVFCKKSKQELHNFIEDLTEREAYQRLGELI